ncbi:MAG: ribose 5-phosphate isomerase B [Saccharospirillaceae bacterium]|nr:ribose 5-phosphate isomerase B [Pseudomonadales bacterium]NRB79118.1 ribose 5-phosphate isomerase B [Saccharospirillaceae bacterium]
MALPKVYFANDHGANELKDVVLAYVKELGYEVEDLGCDGSQSVNYPDYADLMAKKILADKDALGILMCGTGIGISIAANRHKGIRAALCVNEFMAKMTRQHNDANVLVMGGRVVGTDLGKSIAQTFLENDFEGGRHQTRIDMFN